MSGTLVHVQQRRVLRRSVRVDCQVVRERDFRLVGSRGVDLSPDGMLVMAPGARADRGAARRGVPAAAQRLLVRRRGPRRPRLHGRRPGDKGRCFGLEFEPLEPDVEFFLRRALRGVPPPLPMREPRIDYAASVALAALS